MSFDRLTSETQLLTRVVLTAHHSGLTECLAVIFKVWSLGNAAFVCFTLFKLEQKDTLSNVRNIPQKLFIGVLV
jgi:hypothetical protein